MNNAQEVEMIYKQAEIVVDSIFVFDSIYEIKICSEVNKHTIMTIHGILDSNQGTKVLFGSLKSEKVYVKTTDDIIIFAGISYNVEIKEQAGLFIIVLTCIGASYLLDTTLQKRSFQYSDDTYADILRLAYKQAEHAVIYTPKGDDIKIIKPIFQYNETDWNFTHRMAGHLKTVVIPNDQVSSPQICIGIPNRPSISLTDIEYTMGRNEQDGIYYKFYTDAHMFLGDSVYFLNAKFNIMKKISVYRNNFFKNTYIVGSEAGFAVKKYNLPLSGLTLKGTVLDTQAEILKTHLEIDPIQDVSKAYWFSFVPQSGNVMYSMPQHGTKIMLKFNTDLDCSPVATECYRENGDSCAELNNYHYRYYTTEFKKRMAMFPTRLFFFGGSNLAELNDKTGIHIKTGKKTVINSENPITFDAKKEIIMLTPAHIYMTKFNTESVIDLNGSEINIESTPHSNIKPTLNGGLCSYPPCYIARPLKISKKLASIILGFIPKRPGK